MHLFGMNILRFRNIQLQLILFLHICSSILFHYTHQLLRDFDPRSKQPCIWKDKEQPYLFSNHVSQHYLDCCVYALENNIQDLYPSLLLVDYQYHIFSGISPLLINKSISFDLVQWEYPLISFAFRIAISSVYVGILLL